MTPVLAYLAIAGVAVPVGGSLLVARTYRTDPWLKVLPTPSVTMATHAAAALCAVMLMGMGVRLGLTPLAAGILGPLFGMAFLTDVAGRILPDLLTGTIAAAGLALAQLGGGMPVAAAIVGMAGTAIIFSLFRRVITARHGDAAFAHGDVKLLAASAAFLSVQLIACSIMLACVFGFVALSLRRIFPASDPTLPFGSLYIGGVAAIAATPLASSIPSA